MSHDAIPDNDTGKMGTTMPKEKLEVREPYPWEQKRDEAKGASSISCQGQKCDTCGQVHNSQGDYCPPLPEPPAQTATYPCQTCTQEVLCRQNGTRCANFKDKVTGKGNFIGTPAQNVMATVPPSYTMHERARHLGDIGDPDTTPPYVTKAELDVAMKGLSKNLHDAIYAEHKDRVGVDR